MMPPEELLALLEALLVQAVKLGHRGLDDWAESAEADAASKVNAIKHSEGYKILARQLGGRP